MKTALGKGGFFIPSFWIIIFRNIILLLPWIQNRCPIPNRHMFVKDPFGIIQHGPPEIYYKITFC